MPLSESASAAECCIRSRARSSATPGATAPSARLPQLLRRRQAPQLRRRRRAEHRHRLPSRPTLRPRNLTRQPRAITLSVPQQTQQRRLRLNTVGVRDHERLLLRLPDCPNLGPQAQTRPHTAHTRHPRPANGQRPKSRTTPISRRFSASLDSGVMAPIRRVAQRTHPQGPTNCGIFRS